MSLIYDVDQGINYVDLRDADDSEQAVRAVNYVGLVNAILRTDPASKRVYGKPEAGSLSDLLFNLSKLMVPGNPKILLDTSEENIVRILNAAQFMQPQKEKL
jgi:hypothetical protein